MGVKRAEEDAPISAAPSKIQVAEKEKKFPRSEENCGKIFTGEKNLRYLNTRSRAPPNGGSPVRRLFVFVCQEKRKMIGVIVNVLAVALGGVLGKVFS